jgi:hypothetical protein
MIRSLVLAGFLTLLPIAGCSLMLDEFSTRHDGGDRDADGDAGPDAGDPAGDDGGGGDEGAGGDDGAGGDAPEDADGWSGDDGGSGDDGDADWWDSRWPYRLKIVLDASEVTQDLEDVPVLVVLDQERVNYDFMRPQGADLRFVDADGNLLDHQIGDWRDGATSVLWVKMPLIRSGSAGEVLWLYYGKDDATSVENPTVVWDGFYNAVYHLNESAATVVDSSARQNHAEVHNATYTSSGRFGGAYRFTPNASNRIEAAASTASAVLGTFEGWLKYQGGAGYPNDDYMIFGMSKDYCGSRNWVEIASHDPAGYRSRYESYGEECGIGFARVTTGFPHAPGEWHQVAYTWDTIAHQFRIYVDGIERNHNLSDTPTVIQHDAVYLGAVYSDARDGFEGVIDEARISGVVRSADWIRFQYCVTAQTCVTYLGD